MLLGSGFGSTVLACWRSWFEYLSKPSGAQIHTSSFWEKRVCVCLSVEVCQPLCPSEDYCLGWGGVENQGVFSLAIVAKVQGMCRSTTPGD